MAYVVRRPGSRWEIRESVATKKGPRARTLASFRRLTPAVVAHAVQAASRPTNAAAIQEAARRAGAGASPTDAAARVLLAELAQGRPLTPVLRRLLLDALGDHPDHDPPAGGVVEWLAATPAERGAALQDALGLVDAIPLRPRGPLRYPPLREQRSAHG